ncbi:MAG: pyridoxamine 5'-phosphate oxidase family protein [Acidimicrobiia bacterium]|nr:pyridoxamine 5'-phosphate oxidase family protein [Acidimicrobiia bacterium]
MARKDISLTDEELSEFLEAGHTLHVASIDADGFPHLAPMWYVVRDGKITFRSFTKSQKIVNLRRNPKLSVLLESGETYDELKGVMIRGTATLVEDRATVLSIYGTIAAKYRMVGGRSAELDDEALEAAFGSYAEKNTAVFVEPLKVASWDHSKLGGAY